MINMGVLALNTVGTTVGIPPTLLLVPPRIPTFFREASLLPQHLMPQERELACIQLHNRILMWHRKNGHQDTLTQDQHHNPTVDRQPRDVALANYAKRTTSDRTRSPPHLPQTHTTTSADSSPLVIQSRTPSPTSPAYDRNSPPNIEDSATTNPTHSLGEYPTVQNPPDHPSAPIAHSRLLLSTILQNMKTNPPLYSQIRNLTQIHPRNHFQPIRPTSAAYIQHYHQTTPLQKR